MKSTSPSLCELYCYRPIIRSLEVAVAGGHSIAIVHSDDIPIDELLTKVRDALPPLTQAEEEKRQLVCSNFGKSITIASSDATPRLFEILPSTIDNSGLEQYFVPGSEKWCYGGVLVLKDLHCYDPKVRERLLRWVERRKAIIRKQEIPLSVTLIATMHSCPCGKYTNEYLCDCTLEKIKEHYANASLWLFQIIEVFLPSIVRHESFSEADVWRRWTDRVREAREKLAVMLPDWLLSSNDIPRWQIFQYCKSEPDAQRMMTIPDDWISDRLDDICLLSLTIASLEKDKTEIIRVNHVSEAFHYAHKAYRIYQMGIW